ncbi:DUF7668 domain-containing protein [Parvularcula marina]|uniref:DUF7668 domain-containing protein n=1 Tax=Parvularcula marina TaxID=2292771 RepID=A0A371RIN9_9PROT|nr:hypothetical protein [Parvularcula marina]RFB05300.1 hypothetical protein DX908_08550 [Parvularcula marina]
MSDVAVEKLPEKEQAVPSLWRSTLKKIADLYAKGKAAAGDGIRPIDAETLTYNSGNLQAYPELIGPLSDRAWETSIYVWERDYWQVLVDLITVQGNTSDLVLHVRVYEVSGGYEFEAGLIYVP